MGVRCFGLSLTAPPARSGSAELSAEVYASVDIRPFASNITSLGNITCRTLPHFQCSIMANISSVCHVPILEGSTI